MGLRETKAARTRAQILDVATTLFLEHGYDETTMEQVAAKAEIGTSTLYRYFASKELLVLDPFSKVLELGHRLAERPSDEPLDVALGSILRVPFLDDDVSARRFVAVRDIVDAHPGPRARLWDLQHQALTQLEEAIAVRLRRSDDGPIDELRVALTARTVLSLYELIARRWGQTRGRKPWADVAAEMLAALDGMELTIPV